MYPLGVLFGLGFDTATEVALLFLAAGAAGSGLPFYAILCLPILFAAGMSLLDAIDGSFMNFAYGWRSEEHTSELQSRSDLVCRLLLEKKKTKSALSCP